MNCNSDSRICGFWSHVYLSDRCYCFSAAADECVVTYFPVGSLTKSVAHPELQLGIHELAKPKLVAENVIFRLKMMHFASIFIAK